MRDIVPIACVTIGSLEHLLKTARKIERPRLAVQNEAFNVQVQTSGDSALAQATLVETEYSLDRASELQALAALCLTRNSLLQSRISRL